MCAGSQRRHGLNLNAEFTGHTSLHCIMITMECTMTLCWQQFMYFACAGNKLYFQQITSTWSTYLLPAPFLASRQLNPFSFSSLPPPLSSLLLVRTRGSTSWEHHQDLQKRTCRWPCLWTLCPPPGSDHHHVHLRQPERLSGVGLPLRSEGPHHPVPAPEECLHPQSRHHPLQRDHRPGLQLLSRYMQTQHFKSHKDVFYSILSNVLILSNSRLFTRIFGSFSWETMQNRREEICFSTVNLAVNVNESINSLYCLMSHSICLQCRPDGVQRARGRGLHDLVLVKASGSSARRCKQLFNL